MLKRFETKNIEINGETIGIMKVGENMYSAHNHDEVMQASMEEVDKVQSICVNIETHRVLWISKNNKIYKNPKSLTMKQQTLLLRLEVALYRMGEI